MLPVNSKNKLFYFIWLFPGIEKYTVGWIIPGLIPDLTDDCLLKP